MYIGNIVTEEKIKVSRLFNVVKSKDRVIDSIPTLYIGLDNAKSLDVKLNFLERKIDENTFWTFNKREKRVLMEDDLYYFIEHSFKNTIKDIEYEFIDCILLEKEELTETFDLIEKTPGVITYKKGDMVFIMCQNSIFGVDLAQLSYMGRDKNKFCDTVKAWSDVFLEGEQILIEYKNDLSMFNDEVKYLPKLYSIKHYE